jgi:L-alanine-DL-glutamate epimerase-like enolase superfamily enzyme
LHRQPLRVKASLIRAVQALRMRLPFDHWASPPLFAGKPRTTLDSVLVRVELDSGLVGWGESYGGELESTVSMIDSRVAPLARGRDAADAALVPALERTLHNLGRSGPLLHALSGLDIALWDLRAKLEGVPLHALLGGARRTSIRAYGSLLQYNGNEEDVRRNVERTLAAGFREVKLHERTARSVKAAREVAGASTPLMVDTNCAWIGDEAIAVVREMASCDPLWVEEPIWPPEDHASLLRLKAATGVTIAVGENATSRMEFAQLQATGAADVLQPSAIKSGGVSLLLDVSRACAGTPMRFSPQSAFFGPGFIATLHVLAAHAREVSVERIFCNLTHTPYASSVPFEAGHFILTDSPGLGADPEPELLHGKFVT